MDVRSSALGALYGLACGDALGMPTQSMSPDQIEQAYGGPVTGFRDAVDWQPIAPGMRAGSITDDTEQAVLLARRLIADDGDLDVHRYADNLIAWEAAMKAKGSLDLLGPSTKSALQALRDGVSPEITGRFGTTNGGAMRAAPVGIAYPRTPELDAAARRSCVVTHNTVQGIEATTLIAYAVSCGIDGLGVREALDAAVAHIRATAVQGYWSAKASVLERTQWILDETRQHAYDDGSFAALLRKVCGTSVEANESVPAAFAIANRFADDPFRALCFAASLGGDTDTIAAMAGAVIGACLGVEAFDADHLATLRAVNGLELEPVAEGLLAIRQRRERGAR